MARNHRIHMNDGTGKPLCNTKKWQCLNDECKDVECKLCLKIKNKFSVRERSANE